MADPTGYNFQLQNSDGTSSGVKIDLADVMVPKDMFLNSGLWSWGSNESGQLGNNTRTSYSSPIQIGALTNWKQVSSGISFTTAIKTDGTLWAWGNNENGQLGNNTSTSYSSPIQIGSLTYWKQVAAGGLYHTAAIETDGTLWTWGRNNAGQLGNGTTIYYSSPIQIGALTNWKQVACGYLYTAAVKTDGTIWSWGRNNAGQLGNGTTIYYSSPIQIGALTNWKQVSGNDGFTAAVKTDGTIWSWGLNDYGQLGLGNNPIVGQFSTTNVSSPMQVVGGSIWSTTDVSTQVVVGHGFRQRNFVGITSSGALWICGDNSFGNIGNGTVGVHYSSPVQVGSLTNWKTVSPSVYYMMAIKTDGTLWSWGYNPYGNLGNGTTNDYYSPIQIGSLTNWKQTSTGSLCTAAVKTDGTLWTWGWNDYGQLGNGTVNIYYSSPIQVGSLTNWKQVCISGRMTAAVKTDGTLWTWGGDAYGSSSLGTGVYNVKYSSPVQVGSLTNWSQVAVDGYCCAAVKTDGTLWSWGWNPNGNLGNETRVYYSSPIQIGALTNWKYVQLDYSSGAKALKTDGTLWAWGGNQYGQLGNGTTIKYSSPIQIGALSNWTQVSCGYATWAYNSSGQIYSWGQNNYGQLGAPTIFLASLSSPIQIGSLTNWKQVSCGRVSSSAIKTDGTLWAWGYNGYGMLGNGTTIHYSSPIQIGSLTSWKQVSAGNYVTAAVKTDGTLWAWGLNAGDGAIGNGTNINYSSPVQVGLLTNWKQVSAYNLVSAIQSPDLEIGKYVPSPPTDVTVTILGNTSVSVSFTAPTYNGNDLITSYEVSY